MAKLAKAQMNITGKIDITDNSDEIKAQFLAQIPGALEAIGGQAEAYAKEECPVDTGRLRNSITFATATAQGDANTSGGEEAKPEDYAQHGSVKENMVVIGTNVEYAPAVEFTDMHHKVGKAHFLRDAATTHGEDYKKIVEAALKA